MTRNIELGPSRRNIEKGSRVGAGAPIYHELHVVEWSLLRFVVVLNDLVVHVAYLGLRLLRCGAITCGIGSL